MKPRGASNRPGGPAAVRDIVQDSIDAGRRKLIKAAGRSALAVAGGLLTPATLLTPRRAAAQTQAPHQNVDHTIRIAPISLEIAPNKIIKTTGYNGSVP